MAFVYLRNEFLIEDIAVSIGVVGKVNTQFVRAGAATYSANRPEWMTNLKVTRFWRTKKAAVKALR